MTDHVFIARGYTEEEEGGEERGRKRRSLGGHWEIHKTTTYVVSLNVSLLNARQKVWCSAKGVVTISHNVISVSSVSYQTTEDYSRPDSRGRPARKVRPGWRR